MELEEKIREITGVFSMLDAGINTFQKQSGLYCLPGCGKCCLKPDIPACVLEFLPLAWFYYQTGKVREIYDHLKTNQSPVCFLYNGILPDQKTGNCGNYPYRGLVCRLFGFSARRNKNGDAEMYTCRLIKTSYPEMFEKTSIDIKNDLEIPIVSDYYTRLRAIDPDLGNEFYPINTAIIKALEVVMHYFSYR